MPYPSTITNRNFGSDTIGQFGFAYGGNQYCCLIDSSQSEVIQFKLHMFRSVDDGFTWAELDAAGAPSMNPGLALTYTVAVDGSTVRVLWAATNGAGVTALEQGTFDLSAGLWGALTAVANPGIDLCQSLQQKALFQIIVRGTGDYVLLFSSARQAGTHSRVSYCTYDGTTFGAAVPIPSQTAGTGYMPRGGAYDSVSGITQFLYREGEDAFPGKVWTVGLSSVNVLGTPVQVVAASDFSWYTDSQPITYTKAGVSQFAFAATILTGGNEVVRFYEAPYALDLTFAAPVVAFSGNAATDQLVPVVNGNMPAGGDAQTISIAADSQQLMIVWTAWLYDEVVQQYAYISTVSLIGSGTWTGAASFFTPTTADDHHVTSQVFCYTAGSAAIGTIGVSYLLSGIAHPNEAQFYLVGTSGPTITGTPPGGLVGLPYDFSFTLSGGTSPYVVTSTLDIPGLHVSSSGEITGTPTQRGTYSGDFTVTDANGLTDTITREIEILGAHVRITLLGVKRYPAPPYTVGKIEEPKKLLPAKIIVPGYPGGDLPL